MRAMFTALCFSHQLEGSVQVQTAVTPAVIRVRHALASVTAAYHIGAYLVGAESDIVTPDYTPLQHERGGAGGDCSRHAGTVHGA